MEKKKKYSLCFSLIFSDTFLNVLFYFQASLNPLAMDYLMDVVLPKSCIGKSWKWATNKFESMTKSLKKAFTSCFSDSDRCVLKQLFKVLHFLNDIIHF